MDDAIKKKSGSRRGSFLCFRPVAVIDDGSAKPNGSGDSVFDTTATSIGEVEGDGEGTMVFPKLLTCISDGKTMMELSDNDVSADDYRRTRSSHRKFSRILRAVSFETSLSKKIRKKKARENLLTDEQPKSSENSTSVIEKAANKEQSNVDDENPAIPSRSSSGCSSSSVATESLCSSCASSLSSNTRSSSGAKVLSQPNSVEPKKMNRQRLSKSVGELYNSNFGLLFLLVSLLILIIWGRVCAVFCASTCLFFAPGRSNRVDSPANEVDSPSIISEAYKKRVIMKGLLERNRFR